jgi:hypothetical protein
MSATMMYTEPNQIRIAIQSAFPRGGGAGEPLLFRLVRIVITTVLVAVMAVIMLVVIVPLVVIGIVLASGAWAYKRVKGLFNRAQSPNGILDGRRNVRVINRDEQVP